MNLLSFSAKANWKVTNSLTSRLLDYYRLVTSHMSTTQDKTADHHSAVTWSYFRVSGNGRDSCRFGLFSQHKLVVHFWRYGWAWERSVCPGREEEERGGERKEIGREREGGSKGRREGGKERGREGERRAREGGRIWSNIQQKVASDWSGPTETSQPNPWHSWLLARQKPLIN